ncbi:MAG: thiamine pyrophosphate-dependent enzyme [Nitrososphaeria archaeon]
MNIGTGKKIQWCPGCGNFGIFTALKHVLEKNIETGNIKKDNLVLISGIGCYGYITNYYDTNSFHTILGRVPPLATGMKLANPNLLVIGFAGDGDAYAEGMSHVIHAARRNTDIKLIIHNNGVYGLTAGQFTPTSSKGFKGPSTPHGNVENPINPVTLMLVSQANFVARGYAGDIKHLEYVMEKAIFHKGFSIIDILQPCVTFNDTYQYYKEKIYKLEESSYDANTIERQEAIVKSFEWGERIPIGIFYSREEKSFEEQITDEVGFYKDKVFANVVQKNIGIGGKNKW